MRYFYFLLLLSAFVSNSVLAQAPHIESMFVVEDSSQLQLFGTFGSKDGIVTVANIYLPILRWTDSLIVATIPDTGSGSVGTVAIQTDAGISNPSVLTRFQISVYTSHWEYHSLPLSHYEAIDYRVRLDLEAILRSKNSSVKYLQISPMSTFSFGVSNPISQGGTPRIQEASGDFVEFDSTGGRQYSYTCAYYPLSRQLQCRMGSLKSVVGTEREANGPNPNTTTFTYTPPSLSGFLSLDSVFVPVAYQNEFSDEYGVTKDDISESGTVDSLPPFELIAIQNEPILLAPASGTSIQDTGVNLAWNAMRAINQYRVQFSRDSLFTNLSFEITIPTTSHYVNPSSGEYYWRVAGINSEGSTPWSTPWKLVVGKTASLVNALQTPQPPVAMADRVRFFKPEAIEIYDLLGRPVFHGTQHRRDWMLYSFGLRPGIYILTSQDTQAIRIEVPE